MIERRAALRDALVVDPATGLTVLGYSVAKTTYPLWTQGGQQRLRAVVDELATLVDLVVIDTPPLLALAESREIAALAEEALLVVRWRATPIAAARLAVRILAERAVPVSAILSFVRFST